jgi:hypothetical protein
MPYTKERKLGHWNFTKEVDKRIEEEGKKGGWNI